MLSLRFAAAVVILAGLALSGRGEAASPFTGQMTGLDGKPVDLAGFQGKVVLVVNVASRCGATPQYAGLQKLHDTYKDRGFVVLGFPANDFGGQEPGTEAQIAEFCSSKYGVTFPMFAKVTVKGGGKPALFTALTESSDPPGEISWNFEKFLVGRDGSVRARFKTPVRPEDPTVAAAIEAALAEK